MHIVKLLERRFPRQKERITFLLLAASVGFLLLGIGWLIG